MALKTPNSFEAINIKFDDEFLRYYKANSIIFNSKSLVKIINTNKEDKNMEEVVESPFQQSEKTLAREYVERQQDKETALLKKHRVINDSGVVTLRGIDLICQVMLENKDIRNKIVEYLEGKNN
jgi:hypothetical protein|nr:MAG TPA: hypothetical protein [Caudoviricetes sp.]